MMVSCALCTVERKIPIYLNPPKLEVAGSTPVHRMA
jgi:hypothetical protein